jgi:hypothetical protein
MTDIVTTSINTRQGRLDRLTNRNFHVFTVRVVDGDGNPISDNLRFTVTQLNPSDRREQTLAQGYVDQKGEFRFSVQTSKDADKPDSAELPTVTIRILGLDEDDKLSETQWKLDPKQPARTIKVESLPAYREKLKAPLDKLPDEVKPKEAALNQLLGQKLVKTLEELRKLPSDAANNLTDDAAKEEFRRLKTHAELQILSRNARINDAFYKAGFRTIASIAETPCPEYLEKIKDAISISLLDEKRARELHALAQRQIMVLHNIYTENAVNKAHRSQAKAMMYVDVPTPLQGCDCDCQSAVSPLAYLTDLLDYAITNVRRNGIRLKFEDLITTFGQPFRDLPLDCAASETLVRQVRLCVEVLRAKLGAGQPNTVQYGRDAYEALLREIGTSRNELRAIRLAPDEANGKKERVAQKLGIDKTHLNDLILEGDVALTERNLERLFGLQDTTRDPLSVGAKFDDNNDQIESWRLAGLEWKRNTDENGRIHVSLTKTGQAAQTKYLVQLFRDANRQELRASGETAASDGPVDLIEEAGSGLRGRFRINYQSDLQASIVAVPEFLAWRFQALHQQWKETDWPAASLLDGPKLPIIDPDLLSDDDFYQPFDRNSAYKLYDHRRRWIDDQHKRLDKDAANNNAPRTVAKMLALMTQPARYDQLNGARISVTPWAALPDWQAIADDLQSADETKVSPRLTELKHFALSPENFAFLNAARALSNDELKGDRDRAIDVLLFVVKKKLYDAWRTEEGNLAISLSPPFFVRNTNGQLLHPLRLVPGHRPLWEQELERNIRTPFVDPDLIDPEWLSSDAVYDLHEERSKLLKHYYDALADTDSLAALTSRLLSGNVQVTDGGQTVGQWHALGLTEDLIKASLAAVEKQRPLPLRPEQFGLTTSELLKLLEVWKLAVANPPLADNRDWENVRHILLQAEKRRFLYPEWRKDERNENVILSPQHFKLPENPLRRFLPPAPLMAIGLEAVRWRFNSSLLRDWRGILEPRFEQQQSASDSLSAAVDSAAEATLPALRDVLVNAFVSNVQGATSDSDPQRLERKKRYATNRYLINMTDSGCRKTTRIAQAIETLQLLVWGIRTGQLEDTSFSVALPLEEFDAEWKWLGSYATWRTAMFVFLYPENLLDPSWREKFDSPYPIDLRPLGKQTVLYQAIVRILSGIVQPSSGGSDESSSNQDSNQQLDPVDKLAKSVLRGLGLETSASSAEIATKVYENLDAVRTLTEDFVFDSAGNFVEELGDATEEDLLHIPVLFGLTLQKESDFIGALDLFRRVYDYDGDNLNTEVKALLDGFGTLTSFVRDEDAWLEDELNPHKIGRTRAGAYERYILLSIVKCLLDYAESEFTIDTAESLARARENYDTALRLLQDPALKQTGGECPELTIEVGDYTYTITTDLPDRIGDAEIPDPLAGVDELRKEVDKIVQDPRMDFHAKRKNAREIVFSKFRYKPSPNAKTRVERIKATKSRVFEKLLSDPKIANGVRSIRSPNTSLAYSSHRASSAAFSAPGMFVHVFPDITPSETRYEAPGTPFEFCIPRNPMVDILSRRVESGLFKLNNCMSIAGLKREVPAYAAPTDTSTGLPMPGIGGTLQVQGANPQPTQYRYRVLIERAKQLVSMAQQMEASYLSFLEKRDQEAYTLLRAKQDLKIADANVALQDLRLDEAEHQQDLADLQVERVEFIRDYYDELIDVGMSGLESGAVITLYGAATIQLGMAVGGLIAGLGAGGAGGGVAAGAGTAGAGAPAGAASGAALGGLSGAIAGAIASGGQGLATLSSVLAMQASFERRAQEWEFQRDLAELYDLGIANLQVDLAQDHYDIVDQEKRIAELGAQNASDVVSFLVNKFTSAELYEWMSGVVGDIYRYFLQQATSMARVAQRQLAFERQEPETGFILNDYWTYTQTPSFFTTDDGADRRGMTGSARLLQDITKLDQHAFLSDQRRLQLSKTLSLATLDSVAFQRFRGTGVLPFATTMEMFDRDFPGHFMRLIKRVRTTVIALIPPTEGIKATLSTNGISRVVRGGDVFEEVEVKRLPDQVALTAPVNATGVFELQEQPEMMLPFEGNGLATSWELRMPRAANRFDYGTIADVLMTIDYTALDSPIYREQVIAELDRSISAERPLSFRQEFADAWYDLHNPDQTSTPMVVSFETRRADFPPNLDELRIQHVTLYFACKTGTNSEIEVSHLRFTEEGRAGAVGGNANSADGLISTRQGNAGSWTAMIGKSPIGKWELALPNTTEEMKNRFKNEEIVDILLVITYSGQTPAWPS